MKHLLPLTIALFITSVLCAQDFEWAYRIDNPTSNEVAGMDIDAEGHVYMAGVKGADVFLPYDGEAYITKTDPDGNVLWTLTMGSNLFFGDIACSAELLYLVVQSTSDIEIDGVTVVPAPANTFMAVIVLNGNGDFLNAQVYPENHGQFANLDTHGGVVALQCRGEFNSGQTVIFFEGAGEELAYHDLDIDASVTEIAYYEGWTYLVGGQSASDGFSIDNVFISGSDIDGITFILAFDPDFIAQWGHSTDAINFIDNQVEAGESGIYSYQMTLLPMFQTSAEMWKFNHEGELVTSVTPPTFTSSVTLYPDLALSDCYVALFTSNSFDNNSHEVILFDHDLTLVDEKSIDGASNLYSGQVSAHDGDIYVAHVHHDNLDFNGEVEIIDMLTDAIQYPYLAKILSAEDCENILEDCAIVDFELFDLECDSDSTYSLTFNAEFIDPGNESFDLWVNNEFLGFYQISELPLTITGITPRDADQDIIQLCVNDNPECCYVTEYDRPECPIGDCTIFDFEMFDVFCDSDSTYSLTFNAEFIDPGNEAFDLWVNNEFFGFYRFSALPLTIGGISPWDVPEELIQLCVNDNPECCYVTQYFAPDCLVTGLEDNASAFSFFPNPVQDKIYFDAKGQNLFVRLIDVLGQEVWSESSISSSKTINVSALEPGIYIMVVRSSDGQSTLYKWIKE